MHDLVIFAANSYITSTAGPISLCNRFSRRGRRHGGRGVLRRRRRWRRRVRLVVAAPAADVFRRRRKWKRGRRRQRDVLVRLHLGDAPAANPRDSGGSDRPGASKAPLLSSDESDGERRAKASRGYFFREKLSCEAGCQQPAGQGRKTVAVLMG